MSEKKEILKLSINNLFLALRKINYYNKYVGKLMIQYSKVSIYNIARLLYDEILPYEEHLFSKDNFDILFTDEFKIFNKKLCLKMITGNNREIMLKHLQTIFLYCKDFLNIETDVDNILEKTADNSGFNINDLSEENIKNVMSSFFKVDDADETVKLTSKIGEKILPLVKDLKLDGNLDMMSIMKLLNNPDSKGKLQGIFTDLCKDLGNDISSGNLNKSKIQDELKSLTQSDMIKNLLGGQMANNPQMANILKNFKNFKM